MDFSLTQEQRLLRDEIRKFARKELNEGVIGRIATRPFLAICGGAAPRWA